MDFERLPSFLISLCLHLGIAALIIWWPVSAPTPTLPSSTVVDVYFTLGAPGKSVPEATQAIPEAAKGREQPEQVAKPQEEPPKTVAQVEKPAEVLPPPPPEVTPVPPLPEVPVETPPEIPKDIPIPVEPEKPLEPEPEKPKPVEPEKPVEKKPDPPKPPAKPDINKELEALAKQTGTPTGTRSGSDAKPGQGNVQSSGNLDKELDALAKAIGGGGDSASGRGPGGSGGDGIGVQGDYLQVIHSRVRANWSFPAQATRRQYSTLVNIRIAPDGAITQIRMIRSSGNPFYDSSVENALLRTARFEPPPRPDLMNVDIEFAF